MNNYSGMKLDGRYELLELIGSGGMAEIYKADDTVENKTVAVKILKNEFAGSEEILRRFRNESKAIALLSHPNIVKIFDVGFTESVQFIVMEYIDGLTLTEHIERQGVLKWRESTEYVRQILKALQHAHDRGIVHRDVKSQNVMLLRDGSIKVMDFGIARFNREIDKTLLEKTIGSVHYISPEQARGDATDEKSDLYSVGVMLYEMLTGVKPFDGDDALAIALMHTNKTPKLPTEINASIPEGLEEITIRAMQKDSAQRYQTAGEMMGDLKEFEKNPSVIFEYKYSTPDGSAKYLNKAGKPTLPPPIVPSRSAIPQDDDYDSDYDEDYDEDDEVVERRSPLLTILFAVASAFVVAAAILIAMVVGNMLNRGGFQDMPDLLGMTIEQVRAEYDGLLNINFTHQHSPTAPRDTIMEQDVRAGTPINPNQTPVNAVVSLGRKTVRMPDFTQRLHTAEEVRAELERQNLTYAETMVHDPEIPVGHFVGSERQPGDELDEGDTVRVRISMGKAGGDLFTTVIDFVGMTEAAANQDARANQLTPSFTPEESSEEMVGRVVRQNPPPDTEVAINDIVELFIGSGPPDTSPEDVERLSAITFQVPEGWSGTFEFIRYVDGSPVETRPINVSIVSNISMEFRETGVKLCSVAIRNPVNGEEALFVTYKIDFTQNPPVQENPPVFIDPFVLDKITAAPTVNPSDDCEDCGGNGCPECEDDVDLH